MVGKESKLALAVFLLAIFILPVVSADLEFTPEERDEKLGFSSKLRMFFDQMFKHTLTTAGQGRRCDDYPYESKIITKTTTVCTSEDLVNEYVVVGVGNKCPDGSTAKGWCYMGEYEGPRRVDVFSGTWAYECY